MSRIFFQITDNVFQIAEHLQMQDDQCSFPKETEKGSTVAAVKRECIE